MPFKFAAVCDLLQTLEHPYTLDKLIISKQIREFTQKEIVRWFQRHKSALNQFATDDAAVVLMLRPALWTDRDFGILGRPEGLERLLARILMVTREQNVQLQQWKSESCTHDLAICVEKVLSSMERDQMKLCGKPVTVEEVEEALLKLACFNPGSSPEVKAIATKVSPLFDQLDSLQDIYARLQPQEAKWLTRMILKTTAPVKVPTDFGLGSHYSSLPNILKVHVELPSSSAVGARIAGVNGVYKNSVESRKRRSSTPPRDGEYVSSRKRRVSPGAPIFRRGILRPIGSSTSANETSLSTSSLTVEKPVATTADSPTVRCQVVHDERDLPQSQTSGPRVILQPANSTDARINSTTAQPLPEVVSERRSSSSSTLPTPPSSSENAHIQKKPNFKLGLLTPDLTRGARKAPVLEPSLSTPETDQRLRTSRVLEADQVSLGNSSSALPSPLLTAGTGCCMLSSTSCPFANCIFLLAPSVPMDPIHPALAIHGSHYLLNTTDLKHTSLPSKLAGRNARKIILVESRNFEESVQIARDVRDLELKWKFRNAIRDFRVEVYDYRILDLMAKKEMGKTYTYDIWQRCWICIV